MVVFIKGNPSEVFNADICYDILWGVPPILGGWVVIMDVMMMKIAVDHIVSAHLNISSANWFVRIRFHIQWWGIPKGRRLIRWVDVGRNISVDVIVAEYLGEFSVVNSDAFGPILVVGGN
jgi:hypothetical protein